MQDLLTTESLVGCVLYLPLYELDGSSFMSKDAYGTLCTVTGAIWTPHGRDFSGTDQFIELAAADTTRLDFTSGDSSGMVWVKADEDDSNGILLNKGAVNVNGWWFELDTNKSFNFRTSQDSANQATVSTTTGYIKDVWHCLAFTRKGAAAVVYKNGVDDTATAATHTNPASASNNKFLIGVTDDETSRDLDGKIGEVWVWNYTLTPQEILNKYLTTKWRYR